MASKYGKKASEKTSWEFRSGVLSSFLWSGGALPGRGVPSRGLPRQTDRDFYPSRPLSISPHVVALRPQPGLRDPMSERQVRRLPVVDRDKRLVGIVALGDFAVESSEISTPSAGQRTDRDSPGEDNNNNDGQPFKEEFAMAKCDGCGNDYDKSFQVVARGKTHTFDSFECAIHTLAPTLRALRRAHHRPRPGEERPDVLLRSLRRTGRREGTARPRLIQWHTLQS